MNSTSINSSDKKKELKDLQNQREKYITRIFWLSLEIALVLLIPAVIAGLISKYYFPNFKFVFLGISFIISWVIIIFRYKKILKS